MEEAAAATPFLTEADVDAAEGHAISDQGRALIESISRPSSATSHHEDLAGGGAPQVWARVRFSNIWHKYYFVLRILLWQ